jgi:hypothetical protein
VPPGGRIAGSLKFADVDRDHFARLLLLIADDLERLIEDRKAVRSLGLAMRAAGPRECPAARAIFQKG